MGHIIQGYEKFRRLIQSMMNRGEIEFSKKVVEDSINMIIGAKFVGGSSSGGPKSFQVQLSFALKNQSGLCSRL